MLEKHKNLIKNKLDNKEYEVSDSVLRIKIDDNKEITNNVIDNKSIWYIDDLVLTVDKVDLNDCIGIITIASSTDFINIKILASEVYVDYQSKSVRKYNINSFNTQMILMMIEDFNNSKNIINRYELSLLLEIIEGEIAELFSIITKNKSNYVDEYEKELNNLRADYIMKESKILKKIKSLNMYSGKLTNTK